MSGHKWVEGGPDPRVPCTYYEKCSVCGINRENSEGVDCTAPPPDSRESRMVTLRRDETGRPSVWCDPEIADLVQALNAGGIPTIASCSGHGHRPGDIGLKDGRWLVIAPDEETRKRIEALFPVDINGESGLPSIDKLVPLLGTEPDAAFTEWRNSVPDKHWVKLDLSALRIGYELGKARRLTTTGQGDVEEMLEACVPGGSSCDPQQIADNIRQWFGQQQEG